MNITQNTLYPVTDEMFDQAVDGLKRRGFDVLTFDTAQEAKAHLLKNCRGSVGFGGCVSARDLNIYEELVARGQAAAWHWKTPESQCPSVYIDEITADDFICSANALTTDGVIRQIDGNGNRVAANAYGPGRLWYIIGANKVVSPERALERIKRIACPHNARRLGLNTPCAKDVPCDLQWGCKSPERMCKSEYALTSPQNGRETHVLLVREAMGF